MLYWVMLNKSSVHIWTLSNSNYVRKRSHSINLKTPKLHTATASINWLPKTIKNGGDPKSMKWHYCIYFRRGQPSIVTCTMYLTDISLSVVISEECLQQYILSVLSVFQEATSIFYWGNCVSLKQALAVILLFKGIN